ncbi:MAG: type I asparaginase [Porphyromonas sp.]|nr:type I asparaginase [Porphyromonas sp.]
MSDSIKQVIVPELNSDRTEQGNVPSVLLIYTGGTIGMIENPETGVLEAFDFDYVQMHVPEMSQFNFRVDTYTLSPILDSSDVGPDLWVKIADLIQKYYDAYDGFVVLHGTDTMAYTASALSFMIEGLTKPVLLTGSQLPIGKIRTDGKENLLTSIEIAAAKDEHGRPYVHEVCVLFDNQLLRGNRSTKIAADQFNAFSSPNYPNLATVGIDIEYKEYNMLPRVDDIDGITFRSNLDSNILILRIFPGISDAVLTSTLGTPGVKAVVLETFGSGNAPTHPEFLMALETAVKNGIIVVNVTQCQIGRVEMKRYGTGATLLKAGVVSGVDMTVEAAVTKLMYLLGQDLTNEEVKKLMSTNLRGELNERP